MRKLILGIFFLLVKQALHSQVLIALLFGDKLNNGTLEFGLMGGPGFSSISNFDNQAKPLFDIGLYFNIRISDDFYLHPEAIPKSSFGGKNIPFYATADPRVNDLFSEGLVDRKIKAISVPLLARYRLTKKFFVEGGPQVDLMYSATDQLKAKASDGNQVVYKNDVSGQYNWFSLDVAGGLVWRFKDKPFSMSLAARYFVGLTDIQRSLDGKQVNEGAFLFLYIPIGSSKAAKKQAAANKTANP